MPGPSRSFVYWNSRKRCFSCKTGKEPVRHLTGSFCLRNATFKVSEAGRQRALRERVKNVHAKIHGVLEEETISSLPSGARRVKYNPFKQPTFVLEDGTPIHQANTAHLINNEVWIT